jgi:hypothetical protein
MIVEHVNKHGTKSWSLLASKIDRRTGKQMRERWHNQLDPNIRSASRLTPLLFCWAVWLTCPLLVGRPRPPTYNALPLPRLFPFLPNFLSLSLSLSLSLFPPPPSLSPAIHYRPTGRILGAKTRTNDWLWPIRSTALAGLRYQSCLTAGQTTQSRIGGTATCERAPGLSRRRVSLLEVGKHRIPPFYPDLASPPLLPIESPPLVHCSSLLLPPHPLPRGIIPLILPPSILRALSQAMLDGIFFLPPLLQLPKTSL